MNRSTTIAVLSSLVFLLLVHPNLPAQDTDTIKSGKYTFTRIRELAATSVKDQSASGTCWSFATTSFLESEILRLTKDTLDLSEMYFVRKCYEEKADHYIRFHGTGNFGEGGQAHDVLNVVHEYGMVNNTDYTGLANGQIKPDHSELEAMLKAMLDVLVKNPAGKLSPGWRTAFNAVLDVYLGKLPENMSWKGQPVSPSEFRDINSINANDYIEITSYLHHPFYSKFILEIPDNWAMGEYYNLPLDEFMHVINNSLENGFTVAWDGDVSDKGFSHKNGMAIVPDVSLTDATGTDRNRWEKLTDVERGHQFYSFDKVVPEKNITQEMRQAAFDNYSSTDDHLMHITGYDNDQNGKRYYTTKNSWSSESNEIGGYLCLSVAYVKLNTIAIMIHKDALPNDIRKKLKIN